MPYIYYQQLQFLYFENLWQQGVRHGFFTRNGGVSPTPWQSLNIGGTVGDNPENVSENRARMFEAIGKKMDSMYDVWQVHSNKVVVATKPRLHNIPIEKADAIITNQKGITLFMRFADCVPIMLYDPKNQAIGIVHSGWKGTTDGIIMRTLKSMKLIFNSNPKHIFAAIGPAIGVDHYEIGSDVIAKIFESFGDAAEKFLHQHNGSTFFDIKAANYYLLNNCGVSTIEVSSICTACDLENWYSHRRENGNTGRFGVLISLE